MANTSRLSLQCQVSQSLIKADKKKGDSVIVTRFMGLGTVGLFKNFSKPLEDVVFKTVCWETVKTGQIVNVWVMILRDTKTGIEFARIKGCVIENIVIKSKDGELEVTISIQHRHSTQQPSLEAAISALVTLELEPDVEILPGAMDAEPAEE